MITMKEETENEEIRKSRFPDLLPLRRMGRCLRCGASLLHRIPTYPDDGHICIICGRPWD